MGAVEIIHPRLRSLALDNDSRNGLTASPNLARLAGLHPSYAIPRGVQWP
jgi:hypothetical protein